MSEAFPASLLLPADAFDVAHHQVMGRRVAGSGFAQGLCGHLQPGEQLTVFTGNRDTLPQLQALLQPRLTPGAQLRLIGRLDGAVIAESGCLHLPDPGLHRWCWLRAGGPASHFSITGVTHTLCSHTVMQGLEQLVTAPLEEWDALICTSQAARAVVDAAMDGMGERIARRFGHPLPPLRAPQRPVIPLGLDPSPFQWQGRFASREEQRRQARQALDLPQNARVVVFVGRLSFHSKAHPLPLYRALERLSQQHQLVLLECGHLFNTTIASAFDQLKAHFPTLNLHRLGGTTPASEHDKRLALAAADIFCSPADNLQETFGLSLLEAMASSLPVIASDWNGYRDLVVHGHTGWLVPCRDLLHGQDQPDQLERDFSLGLVDYDTFVGLRSLGVVLDHHALEAALGQLLAAPDRCRAMGEAGLARFQQLFSAERVSLLHRELWCELQDRRQRAAQDAPSAPWPVAHSGRLFASHATAAPDGGPWRLDLATAPAQLLTDTMQSCFLTRLVPAEALKALAQELETVARHRSQLSSEELQGCFARSGIPPAQHTRLTALLQKLGLLTSEPS